MSAEPKEIMVCKFNSNIECKFYLCEEDNTDPEAMWGHKCALDVKLKNAQKEIDKLKCMNDLLGAVHKLDRERIEAANKIIKKICGQCLNEKCTEGGDCHISDLKKALKIPRNREQNFLKPTVCAYKEDVPNCEVIDCNDCPHAMKPRKEKCRVGGVPQNVPSCKELESDEFHDCQGYTSKIVKKENKQK